MLQDCLQLIVQEGVEDIEEVGPVNRSTFADFRRQIITYLLAIIILRPQRLDRDLWIVTDSHWLQVLQRYKLLGAAKDLPNPFLVELRLGRRVQL